MDTPHEIAKALDTVLVEVAKAQKSRLLAKATLNNLINCTESSTFSPAKTRIVLKKPMEYERGENEIRSVSTKSIESELRQPAPF